MLGVSEFSVSGCFRYKIVPPKVSACFSYMQKI